MSDFLFVPKLLDDFLQQKDIIPFLTYCSARGGRLPLPPILPPKQPFVPSRRITTKHLCKLKPNFCINKMTLIFNHPLSTLPLLLIVPLPPFSISLISSSFRQLYEKTKAVELTHQLKTHPLHFSIHRCLSSTFSSMQF